jgi:hypothetical protein
MPPRRLQARRRLRVEARGARLADEPLPTEPGLCGAGACLQRTSVEYVAVSFDGLEMRRARVRTLLVDGNGGERAVKEERTERTLNPWSRRIILRFQ